MSERLEFQQDEEAYWRSAKEFVRVLIADLNRALKEQGIWKKGRKQICTTFAFSFTSFLDQQWMKVDGQTEYPLLCFTTSFLDQATSLADISPINGPHKSVELHAMVCDEIEWFFDEMKEGKRAVVVGAVGEETADTEHVKPEIVILEQPCPTCQGTGQCFCLRKGSGNASDCPRCQGTGQCKHCLGSGKWTH